MKISTYTEKLNKVEGNVYVIEEEVSLADGVYEAPLAHDNVNPSTLAVYTGPKLTGERIQSYALSTPSLMPWKRLIRIYTDVPTVYISYETDGDTVEAEDINLVQADLVRTQEGVNTEENRAEAAEAVLRADLAEEETRAKEAEGKLGNDLAAETVRATGAEKALNDNLTEEVTRAKAREDGVAADLADESARARDAEAALTEDLNIETARAESAESVLTDNLNAEVSRAQNAEKVLTDNLTAEVTRSKGAEKTLADNLAAEVTRAKAAEKTNADAITAEASRGQAAEEAIRDTVNAHLNNKSNPHGVTKAQTGLGNVPNVSTNDQTPTFTQAATLANIASGEKLTVMLGKIAKALADFIAHKADTVIHVTGTERTNWNDANSKKHTHSNKTVIDKITQALLDNWTAAFTHVSDAVKHITGTERTNWTTAYTHTSNKSNPHGVTAAQAGAAPASHTHNYLPLAGGTMTGDLKMKSGDYTATPIKLYAGDVNGAGLVSQAGGLYIAGSGESPNAMYNVLGLSGGAEKTFITSDEDISLVTNCQTIANRKTVVIDQAGKITAPGGFSGAHNPADLSSAVPVSKGGTGAATAAAARTNLGAAASSHTHTKSQITDMPTKVSQFTNDKGYITQSDVDTSQNHTHANKTILDKITQTMLDKWNSALTSLPSHTHTRSQISDFPASLPANGGTAAYTNYINVNNIAANTDLNAITTPGLYYCPANATVATFKNCPTTNAFFMEVGKHAGTYQKIIEYITSNPKTYQRNYYSSVWGSWQNITVLTPVPAGAKFTDTVYTHLTTAGNRHIPAGGASGQFLKWSADGTAVWAADNNTTYSAFKAATASAAGGTGLVPAPAAGAQAKYLRADGTWQTPPNTTYGAATQSASGLMPATDKKKLDGVADNANNYVHPSAHPAGMITQDATHRFATDTEKAGWNKFLFSAAVTVPASGWSAGAPYTQTVSVSGLTSAMDIMLTLNITGSPTAAQVKAWKAALGMIDAGSTAGGTVTFTCYSKKPPVDIPLYLKSV